MVHCIKEDKGKRYLTYRDTVSWYTVSIADKGKQYPKFRDIVPWYTVSREIRVNNTLSFRA